MTPRRIAMISEHASPLGALGGVDSGGQNVYVGQLAGHLAAMGHAVDVFTRRVDPSLPEVLVCNSRLRIVHVPAGPAAPLPKEALLPHMAEFAESMHAFILRSPQPYDLAHANFFMSAMVAGELKRRAGLPYVVTFHALGRVRRAHQGAADGFPDERFAIEERAVAGADRVVAECPQDQADLLRLYAADPLRLSVVPAGFDPGEFWPIDKAVARRHLGLDPDERIVLQLGRMVPRKGVETVIRGLARLVHGRGIPARLLIVGGDARDPDPALSPEIARLQAIAAAERIADHVLFTGSRRREELRYYYSAADVFVTVPWYEPFGITPLEAMACARPVVGAAVGGIPFTVRDGVTGYLVPPKDPDGLAARLADLFRHPERMARMGRQGLKRAHRYFTWQRVAASMAEVYEQALTAGPRQPFGAAPHKESDTWTSYPARSSW